MALNKIGKSYDYRAICDVCGFKKWSYELRERWDGKMVCHEDWEPRNILDFYRTRNDAHRLPWTRPDAQEVATEISAPGFGLSLQGTQNASSGVIPVFATAFPITVEILYWISDYPNPAKYIQFCTNNNGSFILRWSSNLQPFLYFTIANTTWYFITSSSLLLTQIPVKTWCRLSINFTSSSSGQIMATYIDNTTKNVVSLVDSAPSFGVQGNIAVTNTPFIVGYSSSWSPNPIPGTLYIDDLRIWNVTRTQSQIQTYWNTIVPTTTPGLIVNYRFDEGFIHNNPSPITVDSVAPGVRDLTLSGPSYFPHLMNYSNSGI